jgi:6-phosphofructokinase 1
MKKIGILTGGRDVPGMNAAIRAATRTALHYGVDVMGVTDGWEGLINGTFQPLNDVTVSGISNRGGTFLRTMQSDMINTPEGKNLCVGKLAEEGIEGLVIIGGRGSLMAAHQFSYENNLACVGIPANIDNNIECTDMTIGADTAVNTVLEAVDAIRDTAGSHLRLFIIDVFGSYIALEAGICGGADIVLIPEREVDEDSICKQIEYGRERGKKHGIILAAEGAVDDMPAFMARLKKDSGYGVRRSILGHIQRGGAPSAFDASLAARLAAAATEALIQGDRGLMAGLIRNEVVLTDIKEALAVERRISDELIKLAETLSL